MNHSEDLQETPPSTAASTSPGAEKPAEPTLHLQFFDLTLDPLPNLTVRVRIAGREQLRTTDVDGKIDGIQAPPDVPLHIAVQRFDGSFKEIEESAMPASDATWNYISPQLVLETETQLHDGEPGQIEDSIPEATRTSEGDRPSPDAPGRSEDDTEKSTAPRNKHPEKPSAGSAPEALTKPAQQAPSSPRAPAARAVQPPAIRGTDAAPARRSPQATGRNHQGNPMAVLRDRVVDWWNSWTLPAINLWGNHSNSPVSLPTEPPAGPKASGHGSKVPYSPSMLPKVQALIQFAQEQTEYEYGKAEGTAAVVAQMVRRQFKHEKGEKRSRTPVGRCYQYVRIALTRAGIVEGFLADTASASVQASASLAGTPLLAKGFVDVTDEVPDARWAAAGDVIVYSWSQATWAKRKKKYGDDVPNHGHIDIRSDSTYISDFIPWNDHPGWSVANADSPTGFEPSYVHVRIYRKDYDPRPTCRMRAFLACLREYETQAIKGDADRYRALNTPLPGTRDQKSFTSFASHPWSQIPKSSWAKGTSTASGAYQCTLDTAMGFVKQRMLFDLEGGELFTPNAQDRLAVMLMEEKGALSAVRKGDLGVAVKALLSTWASLPGAAQNHGRHTMEGKPMDMTYLQGLYARFLALELAKFGITE